MKKKLISKYQHGEKVKDLNSQLLVRQAGPRGVVDTYDDGVVQLNLPTIEVRPEGVELTDLDKYRLSYENLIYTLRSKGYNNLADDILNVGLTQGIGNALYHYQDVINRRSELLKSKGAHWDENEAKRMGVAAMSAPYAPLAIYGVAAAATPIIRNIISSPLAFVADMAIGTGMSKVANKISEIRTGKNIYERAQERYPNDPVKAFLSGMLRDPGTYVGFNTALRGKNAYKLSKNLIEAGGIKNYRIAKAITNGLDETIPQFHSEIPSPKIIQTSPTVKETPNDLFNQAKFELAKRNPSPSKLSLAERLGVPKAERNLIQRHPNYGTNTQASDNVYIFNRTRTPYDFSSGKLVWKYPHLYYDDSGNLMHNRYTNHWTFVEPVIDHQASWSSAPTTMAYPYKQVVYDNGFPADFAIMDTYWASPNYFTLRSNKAKVLTSDYNQYLALKRQGVDVEFTKEGSDLLKQIQQTTDIESKHKLESQHDAIHRQWAKLFSNNLTLSDIDLVAKEINMYPESIHDFNKAPGNHSGSAFEHASNDPSVTNLYTEVPTLQAMNISKPWLAPVFKRMVMDLNKFNVIRPTRKTAMDFLKSLTFEQKELLRKYYKFHFSLDYKRQHDIEKHIHLKPILNSPEFILFDKYITRPRNIPKKINSILYEKQGGKLIPRKKKYN